MRPVNPGGCRSLHAPMAFSNDALFVSSDEPFAIASMVRPPDASGSGNALTPLSRMHCANLSPFCAGAARGRERCREPPAVAVSDGAFEPQPALISATMTRVASSRSLR